MRATVEMATDGRRIIKVAFRRQSPEASAPVIHVTYNVITPDTLTSKAGQHVVEFLAAVREDTLEAVQLTPEEKSEVLALVTDTAADEDPDWET